MNFGVVRAVMAAIVAFLLCRLAAAGTGDVLRTVADINAAIEKRIAGARYDVTAKLIQPVSAKLLSFYATDETGAAKFGLDPAILPSIPTNAGDIVRIEGVLISTQVSKVGLHSQRISLVAHGEPPPATPISGKDFYGNAGLRNKLVRMKGIVYDAMRDEIDYQWSFLLLNCNGAIIYAAVFSEEADSDRIDRLIGTTVSVDGIVNDHYYSSRITLERYLVLHGFSTIQKIFPSSASPFEVPEISKVNFPPNSTNSIETGRRRVSGQVIASWNRGERILIKTSSDELVRIELNARTSPRFGDRIEASGFQETDFYRINLTRAIWRHLPGTRIERHEEPPPLPVTAKRFFTDSSGHEVKKVDLYGKTVRMRGIVLGLPAIGIDDGRIYVESDTFLVPVDTSACPEALNGVSAGCTVDVTGTFIAETENWSVSHMFPRIREILIAIRTPQDVTIVSRPPWWTTGRLLAVIGGLIASLFAIFGWNIALRRRAERRGKELAAEQVAHVTSELKVYERTRLAVELHDSLSQTLTGVSMGIDTAIDLANNMPQNLKRQLEYTSKTVETCRTELRNCLWDLRSEALEATTMNDAIKRSLGQIVNHTSLAVRFNVPRARLSDKTTHMILRIIRELSSNAIRHGNASQLLIAGCIDGDSLHFSVKDNGTGFDPMNTPGVSDGHFGLQGIQERLDLIDGEMKIESAKDRNTKVTVTIKIPGKRKTSGEDINE